MRKLLLLVILAGCGDDAVVPVMPDSMVLPAMLTADVTSADFGVVAEGDSSAAFVPVIVNNIGDGNSGRLTTQITSTDASQFRVVTDGCNGGILAMHGTCEMQLQFRPQGTGAREAKLLVGARPGGDLTIELVGMAVPDPSARLTSNTDVFNFGDEANNTTSVPFVFSISNPGTNPTGPIHVHLTGTDATKFGLITNCSAPLSPNATCNLSAQFLPRATGSYQAGIEVSASPGGMLPLSLTGNGIDAALASSVTQLTFAPLSAGQISSPLTFMVSNTGTHASAPVAAMLAGSDPTQFQLDATGCALDPLPAGGGSCPISVRFAPTTNLPFTAKVVAVANGSVVTVMLSGTGLP